MTTKINNNNNNLIHSLKKEALVPLPQKPQTQSGGRKWTNNTSLKVALTSLALVALAYGIAQIPQASNPYPYRLGKGESCNSLISKQPWCETPEEKNAGCQPHENLEYYYACNILKNLNPAHKDLAMNEDILSQIYKEIYLVEMAEVSPPSSVNFNDKIFLSARPLMGKSVFKCASLLLLKNGDIHALAPPGAFRGSNDFRAFKTQEDANKNHLFHLDKSVYSIKPEVEYEDTTLQSRVPSAMLELYDRFKKRGDFINGHKCLTVGE